MSQEELEGLVYRVGLKELGQLKDGLVSANRSKLRGLSSLIS